MQQGRRYKTAGPTKMMKRKMLSIVFVNLTADGCSEGFTTIAAVIEPDGFTAVCCAK